MIIDSFLYGGEDDIFKARINYLKSYVDYFVIIESNTTFSGIQRFFKLKNLVNKFFPEIKNKIFIFENKNYISSLNDLKKLNYWPFYESSKSVKAILKQVSMQKYKPEISFNEGYQRELIYHAINELISSKLNISLNDNDWIIISDLDEIPSSKFIELIKVYDRNYIYYSEMMEFVHCPNLLREELWIGSVLLNSRKLYENSIYYLRFMLKLDTKINIPSKVISSGGWHLTSFGNLELIQKKLDSWGHQELNTLINRIFLKFRIRRGFDIFGRKKNIKYIKYNKLIPLEILSFFLNNNYVVDYKKPTTFDFFINNFAYFLDRLFSKLFIKSFFNKL